MRFMGVVSTASEPDGLAFQDRHPLDAETWSVLERSKRARPHRTVSVPLIRFPSASSVFSVAKSCSPVHLRNLRNLRFRPPSAG